MENVFVVQHQHLLPSGEESVLFIGVYRSRTSAEAAVKRLALQPGFNKHPDIIDPSVSDEEQGFYIDKYELDQDHWTTGYATMVGSEEYKE
jgi:hypothetical protein